MSVCAVDNCNGPTLPNLEYCLMHRKLNKDVVNQVKKSNSKQKTSSGGLFGLVLLFVCFSIFGSFLNAIDGVASATGGPGVSSACFGWFFLIFIAILIFTSRSSN